jgi:beta-lactamase class A
LTDYLNERTGTIAAAVYDLETKQFWSVGRSTPQDEASVVKVDILETLLAQSDGAGLSQDDQQAALNMIEYSTNSAATDLWNAAGGGSAIGAFNATVGLAETTPSSCVTCPDFPWPGWGLTTTTPADQITLLKAIVQPNSSLTASEQSYALGLLENVTASQRWGVGSGLPPQVTVALKNGWLPLNDADTDWQVNSIGWVSGLGRNYLVAVFTTGNPSEQYGIDTIDQISADLWAALG